MVTAGPDDPDARPTTFLPLGPDRPRTRPLPFAARKIPGPARRGPRPCGSEDTLVTDSATPLATVATRASVYFLLADERELQSIPAGEVTVAEAARRAPESEQPAGSLDVSPPRPVRGIAVDGETARGTRSHRRASSAPAWCARSSQRGRARPDRG